MFKVNSVLASSNNKEGDVTDDSIRGLGYKRREETFEMENNVQQKNATSESEQQLPSADFEPGVPITESSASNFETSVLETCVDVSESSVADPELFVQSTEFQVTMPELPVTVQETAQTMAAGDSNGMCYQNVLPSENGNKSAVLSHTDVTLPVRRLSQVSDRSRRDSIVSLYKRNYDRAMSFSYFSNEDEMFDQLAVEVENGHLSYGRGRKIHHALRGINLKVPEGAIYGLLGPSGCGKTTLLNAIIGKLTLKLGEVNVFGCKPGSKKSIIPGRGVGFMPQELSLYQEFTIEETLTFFGRLHQIDSKTLKERSRFLLKFLDLPSKSRLVQNLSGGQQRRVSLAAALIHRPPLLILDEPTVGVDPLLRQNIWDHLVELTSKEGMTVIITTHYIEEAKQANVVGLMRKGRLLAEASPHKLIQHFETKSLEDCFLKLCMMDKETKLLENKGLLNSPLPVRSVLLQRSMSIASNKLRPEIGKPDEVKSPIYIIPEDKELQPSTTPSTNYAMCNSTLDLMNNSHTNLSEQGSERKRFEIPHQPNPCIDGCSKIASLLAKNMTRIRRNLMLLIFQFALPGLQVSLLCLCIGRNPFDLPIAVVNHEFPQTLSTGFLTAIDKHTIVQKPYTNLEDALGSVRRGENWGVIHIDERFGSSLMKRFQEGFDVSNETIIASNIKVYLDMTNQQIGLIIQKTLLESFQAFAKTMLETIGSTPLLATLPVSMEKPVYGELQSVSFTEFIAPGVVLSITYIMAVGLTSLSFVDERKSGLYDRSWVSGVTSFQVLVSHVLTQSIVLVAQVLVILIFTFLIFEIPSRGPFILVIAIALLQGVCGMSFGLLISSVAYDEATAVMLAMSAFFPNLILCGIVWPIEGQPHFMRYFSLCLPQTMPTEALRAILSRGWGLESSLVWTGFLVTFGWIAFFLLAAGIIFRFKK